MPSPDNHLTVAVCALTLSRPAGLAELLDGLADLEPPEHVDVRVVIVDNDPAGSGAPVVDAARERLPWPITYVVEPRRGIPFGRNRAIAEAGPVDFVAFIDDDEVPDPRWLVELVAMQRRTGADVVTGPVDRTFEQPPPRWIEDGGFFDRERFADGERLDYATTSSVLIATRILPADQPAFNEAMALTGGTDTHFFERARLEGRVMVWAEKARVTETIPPSRVSARWLLTRSYRRGITLSLCLLDLRDSPMARARRAVLGVLEIGEGIARTVLGIPSGRIGVVKGLKHVWFGVGLIAGLFGRRYEEYRTIHGR